MKLCSDGMGAADHYNSEKFIGCRIRRQRELNHQQTVMYKSHCISLVVASGGTNIAKPIQTPMFYMSHCISLVVASGGTSNAKPIQTLMFYMSHCISLVVASGGTNKAKPIQTDRAFDNSFVDPS